VVVETDPVADHATGMLQGLETVAVHTLVLERTDDTFDHAVSSRKKALRVRRLLRFRPRFCCFMGLLSGPAWLFKLMGRQSF